MILKKYLLDNTIGDVRAMTLERTSATIGPMALEMLFLGTGTSAGVPMIGCDCEVCRSTDPRDKRCRPSVLISYDQPVGPTGEPVHRRLLIDATAELRTTAVQHRINRLDAVLITHAHADHVFGLDDLRRYNALQGGPLDLYADEATQQALRHMFRYIFEPHTNANKSFIAEFLVQTIEPGVSVDLYGASCTPLRLMHGRLPIIGYRFDYQGHSIAYCTDVSNFPPQTYPLLADLDVLVIDALRYRHHPTHMTVDQALEQIDQIRPKRAYLTHIAHDIRHAELEANLPEHVFLPFDGLSVRCGEDGHERHSPAEKKRHG